MGGGGDDREEEAATIVTGGRGDNSVSDMISPSLPESTSRTRLGGSGICDTIIVFWVVG